MQLFKFLRVSCSASNPRAAIPNKFHGGRSSNSKLARSQVDLTGASSLMMEIDRISMKTDSYISDIYFIISFQFLSPRMERIRYTCKQIRISQISIFLYAYHFHPYISLSRQPLSGSNRFDILSHALTFSSFVQEMQNKCSIWLIIG